MNMSNPFPAERFQLSDRTAKPFGALLHLQRSIDLDPLYDERERAALELTEAVTLVSESHVPDEVWDRARGEFDDDRDRPGRRNREASHRHRHRSPVA